MLPYHPSTVAEALLTLLDAAAAARGTATFAIPGGRSPGAVLTEMGRLCSPFLRHRLTLLWVDERAVPRGDPERNDAITLAAWAAGGPLPATVAPMPAESADLEHAASAYADTVQRATAGNGIDVCLLGIGEDGHCASLFPHHPALKEVGDILAIYDSPKPPPHRLTMSLPTLHRAGQLVILALGEAKGQVAAAARRGPDPGLPVSLLPPARCLWYLDDAAAQAAFSSEF